MDFLRKIYDFERIRLHNPIAREECSLEIKYEATPRKRRRANLHTAPSLKVKLHSKVKYLLSLFAGESGSLRRFLQ